MPDTPRGEIDPRFSAPDAAPLDWHACREDFAKAEVYWLTTVREDGRPHVTPLVGTWVEPSFYFCTGADEQKARNLEHNTNVVVTTGTNAFDGVDLVLEGAAQRLSESARLEEVAAAYRAKYASPFDFRAGDGVLVGSDGNEALLFQVRPAKGFGFEKGDTFGQTRWKFGDSA